MEPSTIVVTVFVMLFLLYVTYDLSPYGQAKKLAKIMGIKRPTENEVSEYAYLLRKNHRSLFAKATSEQDIFVRRTLTSETGRALGDYLLFKRIAERSGFCINDN